MRRTRYTLLFAAAGWAALAQTTKVPGQPLEFDVATVKLSAPDARGTWIMIQPGGGLVVKNATVKQLISMSYSLRQFQISGGPGWITSEHFDIEAKVDGAADAPEFGAMNETQRNEGEKRFKEQMRNLLAERFALAAHQETREMPIYALVQMKGGAKLQPVKSESVGERGMRMQRGMLTGMSAPLELLTRAVADTVGRPVIDKTGLEGKFNWKLEWTPEPAPTQPGLSSDKQATVTPPDLSGPSIFTALQEQLGLTLESQKGPAPVLVIDRAERPSAN